LFYEREISEHTVACDSTPAVEVDSAFWGDGSLNRPTNQDPSGEWHVLSRIENIRRDEDRSRVVLRHRHDLRVGWLDDDCLRRPLDNGDLGTRLQIAAACAFARKVWIAVMTSASWGDSWLTTSQVLFSCG
jgi:hypothetical protein